MVRKTGIAVLSGPTGVGKSQIACDLAEKHGDIEIVNADSIAIYRKVDIGSAKPDADLRRKIPHHLLDICDPSESFTAGDFVRKAQEAIQEIQNRGKRVLIVGGSGFYLKALLHGLWAADNSIKPSPEIRERLQKEPTPTLFERLQKIDSPFAVKIGRNDRYRIIRALEIWELSGKTPSELEKTVSPKMNPQFSLWVIDRSKQEMETRVLKRTSEMLKQGLVEETQWLEKNFPDSRVLQSVGYAQVCQYLKQEKPSGRKVKSGQAGLADEISLATRQLIKRQRTWFRGQKEAQWFILDGDTPKLATLFVEFYG